MLHREAKNALKKKGLSPEQIRQVSDIIIDCQDVFADAHSYPDAGEA
jgi:succinyl-CoA synthetase beta subunit